MRLKDESAWQEWCDNNTDGYGGACVKVAAKLMEIIDDDSVEITKDTVHALVSRADDESKVGGITGFMAGAVASMVSQCHERGEEFRQAWNNEVAIGDEGEKANDEGGVLNPALLNIEPRK